MFMTDNRTESFLNQIGVKWTYLDDVRFDQLHSKWRDFNYGRETPVDQDLVLEYAALMEQKSPAPAVIVHRRTDGIEILDGLQRLHAAHMLEVTSFSAYLVNTKSDLKCHMIRIASNGRLNGKAPARAFTLSQAVKMLYFEDGCSISDIQLLLGRQRKAIEEEIAFQSHRHAMQSIGVNVDNLNRGMIVEASKHLDPDDYHRAQKPIAGFFNTLADCRFRNSDSAEYIQEFCEIPKSAQRNRHLKYADNLKSFRSQPQIVRRLEGGRKTEPVENILVQLRAARTVIRKVQQNKNEISDPEYAHAIIQVMNDITFGIRKVIPRKMRVRVEELPVD